MNARFSLPLVSAVLILSGPIFAKEKPGTTNDQPPLALVVVENTEQNQRGTNTDFHRLELAFEDVAKQRNWPVTIAAERFAANTAKHDTELRVYLKPVAEWTPGELRIRSWVILTVKGQKHDFGIVTFRYNRPAAENLENTLEKVFRGAAATIAEKVEPILFPKAADVKP